MPSTHGSSARSKRGICHVWVPLLLGFLVRLEHYGKNHFTSSKSIEQHGNSSRKSWIVTHSPIASALQGMAEALRRYADIFSRPGFNASWVWDEARGTEEVLSLRWTKLKSGINMVNMWGFLQSGYPKMDGLYGKSYQNG